MPAQFKSSDAHQPTRHEPPPSVPIRSSSRSRKENHESRPSLQAVDYSHSSGAMNTGYQNDKKKDTLINVQKPAVEQYATEEDLWNNFVESLDETAMGKIGPLIGDVISTDDLEDALTVHQIKKYDAWATVQGQYPAFAKSFNERQRKLFYKLIDDKAYDALKVWMEHFPKWKKEFLDYIQKKQAGDITGVHSEAREVNGSEPSGPTMAQSTTQQTSAEMKSIEELKSLASKVTSALKKETNIIMLGETGNGKSTMITSMANYFKYESFKAASEQELVTLVPTHFQLFDYENKEHDILVKPNVTSKSAATQNAEYTTSPKIFSFTYKNGDVEQTIRVMDTPGLGDPKGMNYDKQMFESILNAIEQFDELHAICILMKPNESTMTPGFRYCIQQLLSQLHISAVQNIFFCFTFSNTTNYRPGQTIPTLGAVFKNMGLETELSHLEKSRVFCFDNEAIKFLMAKSQGFEFNRGEDKRLAESYRKSSFELFRMLLETTCREPHNPKSTVHLNGTRKLLNRLVKPLVEVTKNHLLNDMFNREQIKQIEENRPDLMKKLHIIKVEQRLVTMETPRMVCTSQKCLGQNYKNGLKAVEYKTVCHNRCLQKEESDMVPNPLLENCIKIKNGNCKECGCSWKEHKHLSYEIEQKLVEYEDKHIRSQLASNMLRKKYLEAKIQEVNRQFENVQFFVRTFCEFSLFLSRNSITQYSDVFMMYINQAIAEEKRKHEVLASTIIQKDPLLDALKVLKTQYTNELESMKKNQVKQLNVNEINHLIKEMLKVGGCEALVEQILTFKAEMVRQAKDEEIEVTYPKGFLGGEIHK